MQCDNYTKTSSSGITAITLLKSMRILLYNVSHLLVQLGFFI